MSYEINILVLNQIKPSKLNFASSIELQNEIDNRNNIGRYFDMWPFLMKTKGILYLLCVEWEGSHTSFPICDVDFEARNVSRPYWANRKNNRKYLRPLIIHSEYKKDFENVLRFLIDQSPDKTILFHTRYQGGDDEVICGILDPDEFFKFLGKNKILFNVCYIIRPKDLETVEESV